MLKQPIIKDPVFYPGQWGIQGSDSPLGTRTVPMGNVYYVHSENPVANDDSMGTDPNFPMFTILAAYNRCVAGQNDVVAVVGQASQYPILATINWQKSYTHLVGISPDLHGVGQRARLVGLNTADITPVITLSANGCLFSNIQIYNGHDLAAASGALLVSGNRNKLENVFVAGMCADNPAAQAAAYSLTVTGSENEFERCSVGIQTILRTAANAELVLSGANCYRNKFTKCEFLSWSVTAGKVLVRFSADSVPWATVFEDCYFGNLNMAAGGAAGAKVNNAFSDLSAAFHQVVMRGKTIAVGCTGIADTLTNIWSAEPVPATGFGVAVNPVA
ncbi:MAG: hypothetical protein WC373_06715 [Smithella sp.]|jgi:hypothetical protein